MTVRFEKIADTLEQKIRSGEISGKLPNEKELASQFSVASMTMSRAINVLKDKGLVRQVHRRGTFVVPPEKKVLRLWQRSTCYFAGKYPEIMLNGVSDVSIETVNNFEEADIVIFPTTIPMNYSSHFMPWPQEIIRKLKKSGKFFDQVFEFHHIGTPVYAVAYSFCPCVLAYNKKLMKKYCPEFSSGSFTCDDIIKLLEKVPPELRPDSKKTNRLLLSMAYSSGSLDKALHSFEKMQLIPESEIPSHERIFSVVTRTAIFDPDVQRSCGLVPMPELNGKRYCQPVSEAVFVPLTSRYPEIAFQLAVNTLAEPFQHEVARDCDNLPANREVAANCKYNGRLSDDIFFDEIDHIHYPREIIDPLSTAVILMGLKEFTGHRLTIKEFTTLLNEEKINAERRRKAIEKILENQIAL